MKNNSPIQNKKLISNYIQMPPPSMCRMLFNLFLFLFTFSLLAQSHSHVDCGTTEVETENINFLLADDCNGLDSSYAPDED
ncbi:MAG: hypothetical protein ACPGVB_09350, partial [Chitinophagales bacterium]